MSAILPVQRKPQPQMGVSVKRFIVEKKCNSEWTNNFIQQAENLIQKKDLVPFLDYLDFENAGPMSSTVVDDLTVVDQFVRTPTSIRNRSKQAKFV